LASATASGDAIDGPTSDAPALETDNVEIWELIAREEIRALIASYNANGDAGRLTEMLEVFTDDAVFEIEGGEPVVGREAIRAMMTVAGRDFVAFAKATGVPRGARIVQHFTSTVDIQIASTTEAYADLYYCAVMRHGVDHWGRYRDDYRLVDGHWRIARRQEWMDGTTPAGMGASVLERET
jgi:uncharacterized protein (TIGR02246 family)